MEHKGQPTVILAKTIKGWTLGSHFEGRNSTHQMKKLTAEDLAGFRDRLYLDIPDSALDKTLPPYYKPEPELRRDAVHARAAPAARRRRAAPAVGAQDAQGARRQGARRPAAAARASRRWRRRWRSSACSRSCSRTRSSARASCRSSRTRPAPSAWTRCSPSHKIYNPAGQRYTSVDRELMLAYKESESGRDPARGHQRGRLHGVVHRRRHLLRHARRADDPDLHLLLDVRVPADRRRLLGGRRPDGPRLPARRHRRPDDAQRRGPPARGRALAAARRTPTRRWSSYDPAFSYEVAHITRDALVRMYGDDPGAPLGGSRSPTSCTT